MMGDYIKIYRSFHPHYFYVKAFNEFDYEYMWASRPYPWLWVARWLGPKAARNYLSRGLAQLGDFPVTVSSIRPTGDGTGFFEHHRPAGRGLVSRIFIERINL